MLWEPEPHIQMLTKSHMYTSTKNVYVGKTTTFYIHEKDLFHIKHLFLFYQVLPVPELHCTWMWKNLKY